MGALAACAWSARDDPGYGGKWAGSLYATQLGATGGGVLNGGFLDGRCASTAGFLTLQFKPQSRDFGLQTIFTCAQKLNLSHGTKKQEGRAVAGNYRAMRGTCTESVYLILGQRSE